MTNTYLAELADLLIGLDRIEVDIATTVLATVPRTIYAIGNGGCAAIASHFAADCPGKVVSLVDGVPNLTRIANDVSYADVFAVQLAERGMGPHDVLLALSVSGESENVLRAAVYANEYGAGTVAFVSGACQLAALAQVAVMVPSGEYELVEDVFGALCHLAAREMKGK